MITHLLLLVLLGSTHATAQMMPPTQVPNRDGLQSWEALIPMLEAVKPADQRFAARSLVNLVRKNSQQMGHTDRLKNLETRAAADTYNRLLLVPSRRCLTSSAIAGKCALLVAYLGECSDLKVLQTPQPSQKSRRDHSHAVALLEERCESSD